MADGSFQVKVYIYDLSKGMARAMSQAFLGKRIDGIWHTGIVAYGEEYFYGGTGGIECCPPAGTVLGQPDSIKVLGETQIPKEMFIDYLHELSQTSYRPDRYHLLDHNCNTFSSEVAQFLTGNDIPGHITGLPAEVLSTPFGQMIRPMIDAMSVQPSGGHALFDTPSANQNPPSSTAQQQEKSSDRSQHSKHGTKVSSTASNQQPTTVSPFVFREELRSLSYWTSDETGLRASDQSVMREVYEYMGETEPSWSLGRNHLAALVRLALDTQQGCVQEALGLLARLLIHEDVVEVLSHDPKSAFSDTLEKYEDFTVDMKVSVVKMVCNCCVTAQGRKFLVQDRMCRPVTRVCVSALCDDNPDITSTVVALTHNLCTEKLNEDMELEIGSALLNIIGKELTEESVFLLLTTVNELCKRNGEVRGLATVLCVDVTQYKRKSDRVTALCDHIQKLL